MYKLIDNNINRQESQRVVNVYVVGTNFHEKRRYFTASFLFYSQYIKPANETLFQISFNNFPLIFALSRLHGCLSYLWSDCRSRLLLMLLRVLHGQILFSYQLLLPVVVLCLCGEVSGMWPLASLHGLVFLATMHEIKKRLV